MSDGQVVGFESQPRGTLAARLAVRRAHNFVGRDAELRAFDAFSNPDSRDKLWFIHGPGGIGKSTLMQQLRDRARQQGLPCLYLDARRVEPNPPAVEAALADLAAAQSLTAWCGDHQRPLLLIDSVEYWHGLGDWLRQGLLSRLPLNLAIVFAGRLPPRSVWHTDTRWRDILQVTPLCTLTGHECVEYLQRRHISAERAPQLARFSRGNALALAMAADAANEGNDPELCVVSGRSVYETLLRTFTRDAIHPDQRHALDACAVAYQLDETLLARVLQRDDVGALYRWLAGLSFIARGPAGLYPHDIVREALMQTMARRAPGRYETIARTVVDWVVDRMEGRRNLTAAAAAQVGAEGMYALRQVAVVQYYLHAEGAPNLYVDRVHNDGDWRALADMTRRHEGDESCAWFEFWRSRYPENVTVIRGIAGEPRAYVLRLDMERLSPADRDDDPCTRRLWQFIETTIQPRPDEHLVFNRFWVNHDYASHHSPEKTQMMMAITNYNLTTPKLRLTAQVFGTRTPSWPKQARAIGLHLVDEQTIAIGEHSYHIFYNDWLRESPMRHYRLFAARCIAFEQTMSGMAPAEPATNAMAYDAFRDAVLDALRCLDRPAALAANPLLASAAIQAQADSGVDTQAPAQRLIALLHTAIAAVEQTNGMADVLRSAYLEEQRSQKVAAAALSMTYSSYRRNLATARDALVAELWRREMACRRSE